MPQLTWPWVLGLSLALLAGFLLANEWLKKRQRNESKPRPRHSASTSGNVLLRPTLPQKVITPVDPESRPPWEEEITWLQGKLAPIVQEEIAEAERTWGRRQEKRAFEAELDQAFLTAPLAKRHDLELLRHNDPDLEEWWRGETPLMTPLPRDGYTMSVTPFRPKGMSLECRVRPDMTIPAGQIKWKMPTVTQPRIRTIQKIENVELVLF